MNSPNKHDNNNGLPIIPEDAFSWVNNLEVIFDQGLHMTNLQSNNENVSQFQQPHFLNENTQPTQFYDSYEINQQNSCVGNNENGQIATPIPNHSYTYQVDAYQQQLALAIQRPNSGISRPYSSLSYFSGIGQSPALTNATYSPAMSHSFSPMNISRTNTPSMDMYSTSRSNTPSMDSQHTNLIESPNMWESGELRKRKPGRKPKTLADSLNPVVRTVEDKKVERQVRNREAADLSRRRRREKLQVFEMRAKQACIDNEILKKRALELVNYKYASQFQQHMQSDIMHPHMQTNTILQHHNPHGTNLNSV